MVVLNPCLCLKLFFLLFAFFFLIAKALLFFHQMWDFQLLCSSGSFLTLQAMKCRENNIEPLNHWTTGTIEMHIGVLRNAMIWAEILIKSSGPRKRQIAHENARKIEGTHATKGGHGLVLLSCDVITVMSVLILNKALKVLQCSPMHIHPGVPFRPAKLTPRKACRGLQLHSLILTHSGTGSPASLPHIQCVCVWGD